MTTLELNIDRAYATDAEPLPVVAGVLTVLVHGVFAAILFLNMSWHQKLQDHATVKLWESLPGSTPKTTKLSNPSAEKPVAKKELPPPPLESEHASQPISKPVVPDPIAPKVDVPPLPRPEMPAPAAPAVLQSRAELAAPIRERPDGSVSAVSARPKIEPQPSVPVTQFTEQKIEKPEIDVEKLKRERALALAELLRDEEQSRLDATIDREQDQRIIEYKERLADRERKLQQGLQEIEAAAQARRQHENERAAQEAASRQITDDYRARISAKIRQRVILPPDLSGNPEAVYEVSLLPGGDVTQVRLLRTSGFATYDATVERAIFAAQPLPVPADPAIFHANFKRLLLNFRPRE